LIAVHPEPLDDVLGWKPKDAGRMQFPLYICLGSNQTLTPRAVWNAVQPQVLTEGYTMVVVCLVLNYAFVGIATSAVVKYLDNMTKTFAANAAMFLVAVISIVFYNEQPTVQLFVGMFVAAIAVETYNRSQYFSAYTPQASGDKATMWVPHALRARFMMTETHAVSCSVVCC
jgi:drug/metabolite transporter (DMT)-like permease